MSNRQYFTIADNEHSNTSIRNRANEFSNPPVENSNVVKQEAVKHIINQEARWGGRTPLEILDGLGSTRESLEELIMKAKNSLVGFWGERVLAYYPVNLARTVYAGSDADPKVFFKYALRDTNEAFENLQKAAVIKAYFLSNLETNADLFNEVKQDFSERYKTSNLPFNEQVAHTVISLHADVISDKNYWINEYSKVNRNGQKRPTDTELIRWAMNDRYVSLNRSTPEWQFALKWSDYMLDTENALVFRDLNESTTVVEAARLESRLTSAADLPETSIQEKQTKINTLRKAVKQAKRYEDSMYFDLTVPDAILQDRETGETVGIVEIKSYSSEEVKRWIEALNYHFENEDYDEFPYGQDGLKVGLVVNPETDPEQQILQLGFNPLNESLFIKMANRANPELLEERGKEFPMIIRLLDDVEGPDIEKLGDLFQRYGYHNFIIQKVGFTRREIEKLAQQTTLQNTAKILQTRGSQNEDLLRKLGKPETWEH